MAGLRRGGGLAAAVHQPRVRDHRQPQLRRDEALAQPRLGEVDPRLGVDLGAERRGVETSEVVTGAVCLSPALEGHDDPVAGADELLQLGLPLRGGARRELRALRAKRVLAAGVLAYGELALTEALFVRLNPLKVHAWLVERGLPVDSAEDARTAASAIISAMGPPEAPTDVTIRVTELVHSYSHAFIKRAAVFAGIERSALSELVLPTALSFFVYAAARGDFVLGGLQALFESELDHLLDGLVEDEHRCALDPGCEDTGGACAVCLHLGEPSCRMFNTALSRKALAGGEGYFDITAAS